MWREEFPGVRGSHLVAAPPTDRAGPWHDACDGGRPWHGCVEARSRLDCVVPALAVLPDGCTIHSDAGAAIGPPANCAPDSSIACPGGGNGWSCVAGTNPEDEEPDLSCSVPQPDGPDDDFCCFAWTYGTSPFTPDDSLACAPYSYGYTCAAGDDPTSLDATLSCSAPTPDGANDDFCCQ